MMMQRGWGDDESVDINCGLVVGSPLALLA